MADLTSISTAVDLSRLPAPDIIARPGFEQIRAEMLADLAARCQVAGIAFDATVESDPAIKEIETAAYREMLLRQQAQDAALQLLVAYATDANLDQLGALVGVPRLVITPADPDTGAAAVMERDDDFRQRIVLAPESFSVAGPELAYVFHAKSSSPLVADASFTSPAPGEALISILSSEGDGTASAELVDTVAAVLGSDGIRPQTDHVTVQSAQILHFAVEATLYFYQGPDSEVVLAAAQAQHAAYLAESRKLGRWVTLSGLEASLTVAGVQRVELTQPVDHIRCDKTQAGFCTGTTITNGGYAS